MSSDLAIFQSDKLIAALCMALDLRDDKQFFVDHPGAVPITAAQVKSLIVHLTINSSMADLLLSILLTNNFPVSGCVPTTLSRVRS